MAPNILDILFRSLSTLSMWVTSPTLSRAICWKWLKNFSKDISFYASRGTRKKSSSPDFNCWGFENCDNKLLLPCVKLFYIWYKPTLNEPDKRRCSNNDGCWTHAFINRYTLFFIIITESNSAQMTCFFFLHNHFQFPNRYLFFFSLDSVSHSFSTVFVTVHLSQWAQ